MRHDILALDVPASGAGTPQRVTELLDTVVVVTTPAGTDTFDIKIQGKFSGPDTLANDEWFDVDASVIAAQIQALDSANGMSIPYSHVRIFVTTMGADRPKVYVVGRNHRTD